MYKNTEIILKEWHLESFTTHICGFWTHFFRLPEDIFSDQLWVLMTFLLCKGRELLFKLNAYSESYLLLPVPFMHFIQMISGRTEVKNS